MKISTTIAALGLTLARTCLARTAAAAVVLTIAGCAMQNTRQSQTLPEPASAETFASVRPVASVPSRLDAGVREPSRPRPAAENAARVSFAQEGSDFDPSISRDGKLLAFASTQHRRSSAIYLKQVDSRVVTQLSSGPADDAMPAISPDGTRIAFASNRNGNWDIFIMPVGGGQAVQVTDDPDDELHPSWSPDGSRIVFCRRGTTSGRWELWVAPSSALGATEFLGYGMFPQWCPTPATGAGGADRILFQLARERGTRTFAIWSIDYRNGKTSNLTELASAPDAAFINPTWSPDGRYIAFAEVPASPNADGLPASARLWMMSADGVGRVQLTDGPALAHFPRWSSDNRLFFVSDRSGTQNIWAMDMAPALHALNSGGPTLTAAPTAQAAAEHDD